LTTRLTPISAELPIEQLGEIARVKALLEAKTEEAQNLERLVCERDQQIHALTQELDRSRAERRDFVSGNNNDDMKELKYKLRIYADVLAEQDTDVMLARQALDQRPDLDAFRSAVLAFVRSHLKLDGAMNSTGQPWESGPSQRDNAAAAMRENELKDAHAYIDKLEQSLKRMQSPARKIESPVPTPPREPTRLVSAPAERSRTSPGPLRATAVLVPSPRPARPPRAGERAGERVERADCAGRADRADRADDLRRSGPISAAVSPRLGVVHRSPPPGVSSRDGSVRAPAAPLPQPAQHAQHAQPAQPAQRARASALPGAALSAARHTSPVARHPALSPREATPPKYAFGVPRAS